MEEGSCTTYERASYVAAPAVIHTFLGRIISIASLYARRRHQVDRWIEMQGGARSFRRLLVHELHRWLTQSPAGQPVPAYMIQFRGRAQIDSSISRRMLYAMQRQ